MIRIGWFSPISTKTGIATYSAQVLEAVKAQFSSDDVQVIIFHPPLEGAEVEMPYPTIVLSDSLLACDFGALFDVAIYHLGNNSLHHAAIYAALMRHPGIVVLHDHVYQHYLAGVSLQGDYVSPSYVTLAENTAAGSFELLKSSGVMRCDGGKVAFVPWESEWATRVPMSGPLYDIGLGAVVHSEYARNALLGDGSSGDDIHTLFMPRPDVTDIPIPKLEGRRVRIACCGHIGPTKGLGLLLNAFIKVPDLQKSFQVVIAGFGSNAPFLNSLRRTIQEARLGAVFELKVDPSDDEYSDVMADCDVFYNLRYPNTEGASLSLMEQLAYGRPVIAYPTGSFAEVPEDACYFLDQINDDQALIHLLQDIAANPADVHRRGKRARAAVADKTAADYALQLIAHVRDNMPKFTRRVALTQARVRGVLPDLGPDQKQDRDWFIAYMAARRSMADLYDNRLLLPDGFAQMAPQTKAEFLFAAHLNVNVDPEIAQKIGGELDQLSLVEVHDIIGKFLTLFSISSEGEGYIKRALGPVFLPIDDLRIWRFLNVMPARISAYLGLHALGAPIEKEQFERLSDAVDEYGLRPALRTYLQQAPSTVLNRLQGTPLATYFTSLDLDEVEALTEVPLASDILAHARANWPTPVLLTKDFHALESVGMWSSAPQSEVYFNPTSGQTVQGATGEIGTLNIDATSDDTVRITIQELSTNRSASVFARRRQGGNTLYWSLALPGFAGPLKMVFETDSLTSPAAAGLSTDTRILGVLVLSVVLQQAAPGPLEFSLDQDLEETADFDFAPMTDQGAPDPDETVDPGPTDPAPPHVPPRLSEETK